MINPTARRQSTAVVEIDQYALVTPRFNRTPLFGEGQQQFLVQSPVKKSAGVGHSTDFQCGDLVALHGGSGRSCHKVRLCVGIQEYLQRVANIGIRGFVNGADGRTQIASVQLEMSLCSARHGQNVGVTNIHVWRVYA